MLFSIQSSFIGEFGCGLAVDRSRCLQDASSVRVRVYRNSNSSHAEAQSRKDGKQKLGVLGVLA
jgi:hypothetical protein